MKDLEEVLNCIGDFSCYISDKIVSFSGTLNNTEKDIVLRCNMGIERYREINKCSPPNMWGNVNGIPVSLLDVQLSSALHRDEENCISLIFSPSEIVIGQNNLAELQVTQMSMSISALNYMFSKLPLQSVYNISKNHPSVLDYTFPDVIETDDRYGHLRIYQTFRLKSAHDKISYEFLPIIDYYFYQPLEIMDAVARMAAVRNLFTFFANYYLPLENISFKCAERKSEEGLRSRECVLYLNGREVIPIPQKPFLITTTAFSDKFEFVWNNWLKIYEEARYIPTLFYEIISNRSTGINRFLNLSQAVEVYSNRYRKESVLKVARKREKTRSGRKPPIHLNHRFEDIFILLNPYLEIEENNITIISKVLSDMRNFFTHYDEAKYIEPSYEKVFAAVHVLEFVLLAIVYHEIGISSESIKSCKISVQFQPFDEFVKVLTQNIRNEST